MIGERLAELRAERGITQPELAKVLAVSVTTISGYERNRTCPSDETKVKIANYFGISLDYLLGAVDDKRWLNRDNVIVLDDKIDSEIKEHLHHYAEFSVQKKKEDEARKRQEKRRSKNNSIQDVPK